MSKKLEFSDDTMRKRVEREHERLQDYFRDSHHVDPDDIPSAVKAKAIPAFEMSLYGKLLEETSFDPDDAFDEIAGEVNVDFDESGTAVENVRDFLEAEED